MKKRVIVWCLPLLLLFVVSPSLAQKNGQIKAGSKVFIVPMDGFEDYLIKAFEVKKVPLVIVDDRTQADFEISGASSSQDASFAKQIILKDWHSTEDASVRITSLKTGEIVYAYSVHKQSSAQGKKSTAEACAKHIKNEIELRSK